ncbi:M16 family metallopeptidase [Kallotenue papyrolyticum]|uniref:M16 family metallopeptidase n=1 Tax=Kallotenue papyrolyticum TaxID=1325125 RepID=UPI00046F6C21|nr:pitrilysin family protein [Kallotenue papyrolyticum]
MRYDHHTLPNGLTIVGEYHPTAQSVAIGFFTRTGARDETPEISGVSHFLEHMMFKGSERVSGEQIDLEFDSMGARYNAFTSEEATVYYGAVLPEFQTRLIDLLAELLRPALRQEDFDTEKQVILEEIAMYKDRPHYMVYQLARQTYHQGHPLGNSVLGSTESISALTRDQMLAYFQRRYVPNNMVVALTGRYNWEAALQTITERCGAWQPGDAQRDLTPPQPTPLERMVADPRRDRVYLCAVAPAPAAQSDARYAAEVLAKAIGGGEGSRLYWALVHPGIAESAAMQYSEEDGAGAFYTFVTCDPSQFAQVLDLLRTTLVQAQTDGLSEDELARARRKLASGLVLRAETPMGRLTSVGFDWLYRRRIEPLNESVDRLLGVARPDVAALLADRPFATLTLVALGRLEAAA